MSNLFSLIDACCEAYDNPEFKPSGSTTHCNQAVQYVATTMGCKEFSVTMDANRMCDVMDHSTKFKVIDLTKAQDFANMGLLVIAGTKAVPHGHVCVVRPGNAGNSAKWGKAVPKVMNVGSENFIAKSLNWSFKYEPKVYAWLAS